MPPLLPLPDAKRKPEAPGKSEAQKRGTSAWSVIFWDEYEDGFKTGVTKPALLNTDFDKTKLIAGVLHVHPDTITPGRVQPQDMPESMRPTPDEIEAVRRAGQIPTL